MKPSRLPRHNRLGNCTLDEMACDECGHDNICDVCHKHDEPRGECSQCNPCLACIKRDKKLKREASR
jgi:hypothetical protein